MVATAQPPAPAVYTAPQVARMAGISLKHLRKLSRLNQVPGFLRLGAASRYQRSAIDAWLAHNTDSGVSPDAKPSGSVEPIQR
jgi:predicted DNA-binding transcriptional regulator AlpA